MLVFVFLVMMGCTYENKVCEFESGNQELKIYNNILTELIETRMYYFFLGRLQEDIFKKYDSPGNRDSVRLKNELAKAQNDIFKDPSQFCTLYMDTMAARPAFSPWSYYDKPRNQYHAEIRDLIRYYVESGQAAIDSLNQLQTRYSGDDFGLCTSRIRSLREYKGDTSECVLGKIRLSKIVLNKSRTEGLMYYDWRCGGLCGHEGLILFEKRSRWIIKDLQIQGIY